MIYRSPCCAHAPAETTPLALDADAAVVTLCLLALPATAAYVSLADVAASRVRAVDSEQAGRRKASGSDLEPVLKRRRSITFVYTIRVNVEPQRKSR